MLWLNGGPGVSSFLGLFTENGPFRITKNKTLELRKYSWNKNHNVIYMDNPVGTGYSFTDNDAGYAKNASDVGRDLLNALVQFFQLFPEFQTNEFYVTGESYGGKYIPAVSYAIKNYNLNTKVKINLKGLAIGNGWVDPVNQVSHSQFLYEIGLIDFNGREKFQAVEAQIKMLIAQKKYLEAFELLDYFHVEKSLFTELTGFKYPFNYLKINVSLTGEFDQWLQKSDVRNAIHVGNRTFHNSTKVVDNLKEDILKSITDILADLLNHYKVLIYNGQFDVIIPYSLTENYLMNLDWYGAQEYKKAIRKHWWVDEELAGYSKTVGNLTEVMVRNAGHMVPEDQPKWAFDLITRFTHHMQI